MGEINFIKSPPETDSMRNVNEPVQRCSNYKFITGTVATTMQITSTPPKTEKSEVSNGNFAVRLLQGGSEPGLFT
jgi:hypothetical protein